MNLNVAKKQVSLKQFPNYPQYFVISHIRRQNCVNTDLLFKKTLQNVILKNKYRLSNFDNCQYQYQHTELVQRKLFVLILNFSIFFPFIYISVAHTHSTPDVQLHFDDRSAGQSSGNRGGCRLPSADALPSRWYTLLALPFPDQQIGRREFTRSYRSHHRAGYFSNPI